jgi:hypothetical protein
MPRSYGIVKSMAANPNATYPSLMAYMASAAGVRPKIFEFAISSHASPADYASQFSIMRTTTAAPTGGNAQASVPAIDPGDPASLATGYDSATGGATMSTNMYTVAVNLRASFRWVAAPGKEFVVPNTIYNGAGIVVNAQSTAYYPDLSLMWEE